MKRAVLAAILASLYILFLLSTFLEEAAQSARAKAHFDSFEQALFKSKSLHVQVELSSKAQLQGKPVSAKWAGTVVVKKPDRFLVQLAMTSAPFSMGAVGRGDTVKWYAYEQANERALVGSFVEVLVQSLTRFEPLTPLAHIVGGNSSGEVQAGDVFVRGVQLGKFRELEISKDLVKLAYRMREAIGDSSKYQDVELILDRKTGLPSSRRWESADGQVELSFHNWRINPEISDEAFELSR